MMGQLDTLDTEAIVRYIVSLQQPDGSFFGDRWGEVDTRFTFCALATLIILDRYISPTVIPPNTTPPNTARSNTTTHFKSQIGFSKVILPPNTTVSEYCGFPQLEGRLYLVIRDRYLLS